MTATYRPTFRTPQRHPARVRVGALRALERLLRPRVGPGGRQIGRGGLRQAGRADLGPKWQGGRRQAPEEAEQEDLREPEQDAGADDGRAKVTGK